MCLQETGSLNSDCGKLFTENFSKFKDEVRLLCESTYEERHKQFGSESPSTNEQAILDKFSQQNKNTNLSQQEKMLELKNWFKKSYVDKVKVNAENK